MFLNRVVKMKVIQLTDLHLFSDIHQELFGVNTYNSFNKIINHLLLKEGDCDAIIVTGDISQDETVPSYELALDLLKKLNKPIYYLQGNHDQKEKLNLVFSDLKPIDELCSPYWNFISADTVDYGKDSGFLSNDELNNLKNKICKNERNNIALIMHHHCLKLGTPLIDGCMLLNSNKLIKIIDKEKKIKLVICGHAHGNYKLTHKNFTLEVAPAVCFQWKKGTELPDVEKKIGYRKFYFFKDKYLSETIII